MSTLSGQSCFHGNIHSPLNTGAEGKDSFQEVNGLGSKSITMNNELNTNNNHTVEASNGGIDVNGHSDCNSEEAPTIDIMINNVVCTFSTKCHLNLKKVAMEGAHVEYRRENGMLNMKLRHPHVTASIWSSGKITCTGSTSEDQAKVAARRVARRLQRLGFSVKFTNYRVVNVLGTCGLPFGIKLNQFSTEHRANSSYEPELHPGVTYRIKEPRASLKIFSTGSITVTAPCVLNVQLAIEHIYPLVNEFKMESSKVNKKVVPPSQKYLKRNDLFLSKSNQFQEDDDEEFAELDDASDLSDDFESDLSQD